MKKKYEGKILQSVSYGKFKVLNAIPGLRRYRIIFLETGYETEVNTSQLIRREVRDVLYPIVAGVGCNGTINHPTLHPAYGRWKNMIHRCYSSICVSYDRYGAVGITVCERWHNFTNFIEDISKLENYESMLKDPKLWQLDKDLKIPGSKVYSPETLSIVWYLDNILDANKKQYDDTCLIGLFRQEAKFILKLLKNNKDDYAEIIRDRIEKAL